VEPLLDSLYGYARKLTSDTFAADLIVVESLYKAERNFDKFTQGTNFAAWMRTIIYNTFASEYRKDKRRPDMLGEGTLDERGLSLDTLDEFATETNNDHYFEDEGDDEIFGEAPPEDDSPSMYNKLRDACNQLREERREVMELRYAKKMKYREIAEHLGVKTGTVMSRLSRAREDLKRILEENESI
jgi:RNA polymerase sigma-70 factor (ECF subfamily)